MADALLRLISYPLPVIAHVIGQTLRALAIPPSATLEFSLRLRIDRWQPDEMRRNFN
jgi:hypothetical protein